jgi:hypothetical protein
LAGVRPQDAKPRLVEGQRDERRPTGCHPSCTAVLVQQLDRLAAGLGLGVDELRQVVLEFEYLGFVEARRAGDRGVARRAHDPRSDLDLGVTATDRNDPPNPYDYDDYAIE